MKKDKLFLILVISSIAVALFDVAAAITISLKIWFFTQNALFVTPFIFTFFIIAAAVNGALIILSVVYLIFRKG